MCASGVHMQVPVFVYYFVLYFVEGIGERGQDKKGLGGYPNLAFSPAAYRGSSTNSPFYLVWAFLQTKSYWLEAPNLKSAVNLTFQSRIYSLCVSFCLFISLSPSLFPSLLLSLPLSPTTPLSNLKTKQNKSKPGFHSAARVDLRGTM